MKSPAQRVTDAVEGSTPGAGADIEELMQQLATVSECDQAAAKLAFCGKRAIPALRRFLFEGKPSVVYQPRRAAVEALGALGAKDILLRYLTWRREIEDPATRFGEESVKNAAARELARFRTRDVLDALLHFALPHARQGIVDALAQFDCAEAIPYFLRSLEDDLCAAPATEALRRLGRSAELALVTSALTRLPSCEEERPSSLRRRARALGLIAELGPSPAGWPLLKGLLDEDDPPIVTAAAKLAVLLGDRNDRLAAARRLVAVLSRADWYLREEIQNLLLELYPEARSFVEQECAKRRELPEPEQVMDSTFRTLEGVRRKAGEVPPTVQRR